MTVSINAMYEPVDLVLPRGGDITLLVYVMEPEPSTSYADLTGHVLVFRAALGGRSIEKTATTFSEFEGRLCEAAFSFTRAELRLLGEDPTPYEIEDRFVGGDERPIAGGNLFGGGGVNPDAPL